MFQTQLDHLSYIKMFFFATTYNSYWYIYKTKQKQHCLNRLGYRLLVFICTVVERLSCGEKDGNALDDYAGGATRASILQERRDRDMVKFKKKKRKMWLVMMVKTKSTNRKYCTILKMYRRRGRSLIAGSLFLQCGSSGYFVDWHLDCVLLFHLTMGFF